VALPPVLSTSPPANGSCQNSASKVHSRRVRTASNSAIAAKVDAGCLKSAAAVHESTAAYKHKSEVAALQSARHHAAPSPAALLRVIVVCCIVAVESLHQPAAQTMSVQLQFPEDAS